MACGFLLMPAAIGNRIHGREALCRGATGEPPGLLYRALPELPACVVQRKAFSHGPRSTMKTQFTAVVILLPVLAARADDAPKRVAALVTEYRHNSHADVIVGRLIETQTLDGAGVKPRMKLVSLYTDQVPPNDKSRNLAARYGFRLAPTVRDALTLGTNSLAVDGILLVAEHGDYPKSATGQTQYPKRRLFELVAEVVRENGAGVPIFIDKHLADNFADARFIYDTARTLKMPLMAGSSLPGCWRQPPVDVPKGARLRQLLAVSYHTLDAYGFHALEMVQCLAERRRGGETGIKAVRALSGAQVWKARDEGLFDRRLLDAALARQEALKPPEPAQLPERVIDPVLCCLEYADGFRAFVLNLNGAVAEWSAAWSSEENEVQSTLFRVQEARPFMHFAWLVDGIDAMMHSHKPAWPAERTLLSSGALHQLLVSLKEGGRRVETPDLQFSYAVDWEWKQPPPPPPDRPIDGH
jgi:hypothetical protein